MNGIYVHIPFCERKCNYCAFSSFTNLEEKDRYFKALIREIKDFDEGKLPKNEIFEKDDLHKIDTIYIGGGTPSLFDSGNIEKILDAIKEKFDLQKDNEITIECNPNSLDEDKIKGYRALGINRLSIGVQSLQDSQLSFIGRLHNAEQALNAIEMSHKHFDNISCDFLIGLPRQEPEEFIFDLKKVVDIGVKHISAYMLQVEDKTPLADMARKSPFILPDDDQSVEIYQKSASFLQKQGLLQYEISNFAIKGYESKHNLKYWRGDNYIGFGLSAHSYVNGVRLANANNFKDYYSHKLALKEVLDKRQLIEERLMLGLRCNLGVDLKYLEKLDYFIENNENYTNFLEKKIIFNENDRIFLNPKYYGVSNYVIVSLLG